jgi:tRNA-binding protein
LLHRQVIAVVNFPPKQIADFISECLVLGVYDENKDVILLAPDKPVANGLKIG